MTASKGEVLESALDTKLLYEGRTVKVVLHDGEELSGDVLQMGRYRLYLKVEGRKLLIDKQSVKYYILKLEEHHRGESMQNKEANEEGRIPINTASKKELIKLPGIGESTAEALIACRERCGFFVQKEELMKVKGISRKRFDRLKESIIV